MILARCPLPVKSTNGRSHIRPVERCWGSSGMGREVSIKEVCDHGQVFWRADASTDGKLLFHGVANDLSFARSGIHNSRKLKGITGPFFATVTRSLPDRLCSDFQILEVRVSTNRYGIKQKRFD